MHSQDEILFAANKIVSATTKVLSTTDEVTEKTEKLDFFLPPGWPSDKATDYFPLRTSRGPITSQPCAPGPSRSRRCFR